MNHTNLPADKDLAGKVIEAQGAMDMAKLDRGIVGILFGTKNHVPYNVAAVVAVVSAFLFAGILLFGHDTATLSQKDAAALVLSLVTLSLGFLFGRASK